MKRPHWFHDERFAWLVGGMTALVAHGAASSVFEAAEGHYHPALWGWMIALLALTFFFYEVYASPHPRRLPDESKWLVFWRGALPWFVTALAAIALYGVAVGVHRFFSPTERLSAWTFSLYTVVFLLLIAWLYRLRDDILVIRNRSISPAQGSRAAARHMICILSSVDTSKRGFENTIPAIDWSDPPNIRQDLETLRASDLHWPWEMLLAAIEPHPELEELTLICSRTSGHPKDRSLPSLPQAPTAARFIKKYETFRSLTINVWALTGEELRQISAFDEPAIESARGFSFSDFDDLSGAFSDLMKHLRFVRKVSPASILIDFTGGMKPPTVVAAGITFRGAARAQYVDTNTIEPNIYDLVTNPEMPAGR